MPIIATIKIQDVLQVRIALVMSICYILDTTGKASRDVIMASSYCVSCEEGVGGDYPRAALLLAERGLLELAHVTVVDGQYQVTSECRSLVKQLEHFMSTATNPPDALIDPFILDIEKVGGDMATSTLN